MTDVLELVRAVKATGDFSPLVDAIPYTRFLGITLDRSTGELVGKLAFSPALIGNALIPALHGGTIGTLLESTAIFHVIWESDVTRLPKTINITIDYLRSARAIDTFARGVITLTVVHISIALPWHSIWAMAGSTMARVLSSGRPRRALDVLAGVAFVWLALKVAF